MEGVPLFLGGGGDSGHIHGGGGEYKKFRNLREGLGVDKDMIIFFGMGQILFSILEGLIKCFKKYP